LENPDPFEHFHVFTKRDADQKTSRTRKKKMRLLDDSFTDICKQGEGCTVVSSSASLFCPIIIMWRGLLTWGLA
jgi:hypothetical protein